MTWPYSNPGAGARISATVKWYNPAKAYGFLVPEDGSPDIYCRDTALAAVGLDTLLSGATVQCETVQGRRGPEVSRILAVDFSTASPQAASFAPVAGNGRMAADPGIGRNDPAEAGPGRRITALVKWFMPTKGYGFLEPEDGSPDVFCHVSAVEASGLDSLPQGAVVTCEIVSGDRSPPGLPHPFRRTAGDRARPRGTRPALRQRLSGTAARRRAVRRPGSARDGQVLRPGAGLRLCRPGRRRPGGVRAFQHRVPLRHVRPGAGPARPRPRGKRAERAPGDGDRAALSRIGLDETHHGPSNRAARPFPLACQ